MQLHLWFSVPLSQDKKVLLTSHELIWQGFVKKRLQLRRREESQSACKYRQKQAVRDILVKCRLRSAVTWIHRGVDRHVPLIRPCTTSCAVGLLASVSALSSHALVQAVLV